MAWYTEQNPDGTFKHDFSNNALFGVTTNIVDTPAEFKGYVAQQLRAGTQTELFNYMNTLSGNVLNDIQSASPDFQNNLTALLKREEVVDQISQKFGSTSQSQSAFIALINDNQDLFKKGWAAGALSKTFEQASDPSFSLDQSNLSQTLETNISVAFTGYISGLSSGLEATTALAENLPQLANLAGQTLNGEQEKMLALFKGEKIQADINGDGTLEEVSLSDEVRTAIGFRFQGDPDAMSTLLDQGAGNSIDAQTLLELDNNPMRRQALIAALKDLPGQTTNPHTGQVLATGTKFADIETGVRTALYDQTKGLTDALRQMDGNDMFDTLKGGVGPDAYTGVLFENDTQRKAFFESLEGGNGELKNAFINAAKNNPSFLPTFMLASQEEPDKIASAFMDANNNDIQFGIGASTLNFIARNPDMDFGRFLNGASALDIQNFDFQNMDAQEIYQKLKGMMDVDADISDVTGLGLALYQDNKGGLGTAWDLISQTYRNSFAEIQEGIMNSDLSPDMKNLFSGLFKMLEEFIPMVGEAFGLVGGLIGGIAEEVGRAHNITSDPIRNAAMVRPNGVLSQREFANAAGNIYEDAIKAQDPTSNVSPDTPIQIAVDKNGDGYADTQFQTTTLSEIRGMSYTNLEALHGGIDLATTQQNGLRDRFKVVSVEDADTATPGIQPRIVVQPPRPGTPWEPS